MVFNILLDYPVLIPTTFSIYHKLLQIPQPGSHKVFLPSTQSAESLDDGPLQAGYTDPYTRPAWPQPALHLPQYQ